GSKRSWGNWDGTNWSARTDLQMRLWNFYDASKTDIEFTPVDVTQLLNKNNAQFKKGFLWFTGEIPQGVVSGFGRMGILSAHLVDKTTDAAGQKWIKFKIISIAGKTAFWWGHWDGQNWTART